MDLNSPYQAETILEISNKIYELVLKYNGSITAEHNDGIIRTPYLKQMYGEKIIEIFKKTKEIFDPLYIFNPNKKIGGTFEDIKNKIIRKNN
jgi:FAD/FMN-containing dehydrogenase